jgi:Cu(I)/Ag(I) efflux system membrane fusion protein
MTSSTTRIGVAVAGVAVLALGIASGIWWARRAPAQPVAAATTAPDLSAQKVLYWYDPMAPDQHFDKPGKSPFMDMQLVPKYAEPSGGQAGVRIDAGVQQNVGIRTAVVKVAALTSERRVPATLTWDLRREVLVSAPVTAIVSRVFVKTPYESVSRGQVLASMLAPEWTSAIAEAQALQHGQSQASRELRDAAGDRLRALGIPNMGMSRGGVALVAPQGGVVSEVLVREGQAVAPGTPLFRINGTDTLWLEAVIPQADSAGVRPGTPVEAFVSAIPGVSFSGEVEALLPQVDAASRSLRARVVLRNPNNQLVPGMFADVSIRGGSQAALPLVPTEALISTGADSRVIVVSADGSFHPTSVRTGRSSGGQIEVLEGLKGGERVVTSGQFLIDSEASLSGATDRLQGDHAQGHSP